MTRDFNIKLFIVKIAVRQIYFFKAANEYLTMRIRLYKPVKRHVIFVCKQITITAF